MPRPSANDTAPPSSSRSAAYQDAKSAIESGDSLGDLQAASVANATPAPSPTPELYYYNDSGKYYHTKNCRFVSPYSKSTYSFDARARGLLPDPECKPEQ